MIDDRLLRTLETRMGDLEAIVDGSEAQTREATTYVLGIIIRFLHEKGLIDERALRDHVRMFEGDHSDREDYMGQFVRQLGHMIDFHGRRETPYGQSHGGMRASPDSIP